MTVHVERPTTEDLPAIIGLLVKSQLTVEGLTDHLATSLVARNQTAIVGTVTLEMFDDGALLRSLAVSRPHKAGGSGAASSTSPSRWPPVRALQRSTC